MYEPKKAKSSQYLEYRACKEKAINSAKYSRELERIVELENRCEEIIQDAAHSQGRKLLRSLGEDRVREGLEKALLESQKRRTERTEASERCPREYDERVRTE